jgi:hypothetical protein
MPAFKASTDHALLPSGGCKPARCRVLSRPGSYGYRGSLRPCIAWFSRAREEAT